MVFARTRKSMNSKVDAFISNAKNWQKEFRELRKIVLDCGLDEEFKWGKPCYTHQGVNIVLIHGFKEYCALLFNKGALLKDPKSILVQQTENVQAARQLRFSSVQEITKLQATIKSYIKEAIGIEKAGLNVDFKKHSEYEIPEELERKFKEDSELKKAFDALTPGRQRGYYLHFSAPKQSKTRESRIEKCRQRIFDGKGYNER
jgi:uncharacterized protein YdeI (YjbR/CyaY-like superfamily)